MDDKFSNIRAATRRCIEQLGASRNEEHFEFRNAANFSVVHELLREYDRLRVQAAEPVVKHSMGTLTAAEASLIEAYRRSDEQSKTMIKIAVDVAARNDEERRAQERCEVVDLATVRRPVD